MSSGLKPLIAVVGNTGAGKSQFAVELAKASNGEIINGDAMQMYEGLDIITNKHPMTEREGIPHHLIGTEPWTNQITVQDFENHARKVIDRIHSQNRIPILVGGTHYYVQSLIAENALISSNGGNDICSIKKKVLNEEQLQTLDNPAKVEAELARIDPVIASKFHPNDTRRLRRALEIWYETGTKPSVIYKSQITGSEKEKLRLRYNVLAFWVWTKRNVLSERLDRRVDSMINEGLVNEVKQLYAVYNPDQESTGIWQVLGFKQFLDYLSENSEENWGKCVERMKIDTRHYAKKQTKWIKNKLGPSLENLGGNLALVDSTNIDNWDNDVRKRGTEIAKNWLQGSIPNNLVPQELLQEVGRRRQSFSENQWKRHRCDVCSGTREIVLIGDDEWNIHIRSKGHMYHLKKHCMSTMKITENN